MDTPSQTGGCGIRRSAGDIKKGGKGLKEQPQQTED